MAPNAKVGTGYVEDGGKRLRFDLETPLLPNREAQRVTARAKITLEFAGSEHVLSATLGAAYDHVFPVDTRMLHIVRADEARPKDLFGSTGAPATVVTLEDIDSFGHYLGAVRFQMSGAAQQPSTSESLQIINGKSRRSRSYIFPRTNSPIQIEVPIITPRREPIDVEVTAGLGIE